MQLLTSLLFLIIVARLLGHLFARCGQPSIVGEMLAGGIEMDFQRVIAAMRGRGLVVAVLGFMLPFGGGVVVAWAYELDPMRMVFLGLCIAITALPVAARMMSDMGMIATPIARYAIATAASSDPPCTRCWC
ncbi:MAG: hypothetical protein FJY25_08900 [Betaproteobacteria bacterium]|nr:hypothetical protein [Betaproteobacteria bacterium]